MNFFCLIPVYLVNSVAKCATVTKLKFLVFVFLYILTSYYSCHSITTISIELLRKIFGIFSPQLTFRVSECVGGCSFSGPAPGGNSHSQDNVYFKIVISVNNVSKSFPLQDILHFMFKLPKPTSYRSRWVNICLHSYPFSTPDNFVTENLGGFFSSNP